MSKVSRILDIKVLEDLGPEITLIPDCPQNDWKHENPHHSKTAMIGSKFQPEGQRTYPKRSFFSDLNPKDTKQGKNMKHHR